MDRSKLSRKCISWRVKITQRETKNGKGYCRVSLSNTSTLKKIIPNPKNNLNNPQKSQPSLSNLQPRNPSRKG